MEEHPGIYITIGVFILVVLWFVGGGSVSNGVIHFTNGTLETASASAYSSYTSDGASSSGRTYYDDSSEISNSALELYRQTHTTTVSEPVQPIQINQTNIYPTSFIYHYYYPQPLYYSNDNYYIDHSNYHVRSNTYYERPNTYYERPSTYSEF